MDKNNVIKISWKNEGARKNKNENYCNFFISEIRSKRKNMKNEEHELIKNFEDLFDNISKVRDFCGTDESIQENLNESNYSKRLLEKYFERAKKCANTAFIHFESDAPTAKIDGMALLRVRDKSYSSSDNNKEISNSYDSMSYEKDNVLQKEFNTFKKRATLVYDKLYKRNDLEGYHELEYFSSTRQGHCVGKTLIKEIEEFIKDIDNKNKIAKNDESIDYILVTNELCDYEWFKNQNFKKVDEESVDVRDLKHFNKLANVSIKNRLKDGYIKCFAFTKKVKM